MIVPFRCAAAVALLLFVTPQQSQAQARYRGVEASLGYYGWAGGNTDNTRPGIRGQGTLFAEVSPTFGVGFGGAYGLVGIEGQDEGATELSIGVVLRKAFGPRDRTHLFLEARGGWTRLKTDLETVLPVEENGLYAGPGVGVEIPVAQQVWIVVAGDAQWHQYENPVFVTPPSPGGFPGPTLEEDGDRGWRYGLRVGVHLGHSPF